MATLATIAALALLTAAILYVGRAVVQALSEAEPRAEGYDDSVTVATLAQHALEFERLTLAIAEGIQHVDRAQRRIQATVQRARQELSENGLESPGLEAEYSELRVLDGGGGGGGEMQVMPEPMEELPLEGLPGEGITSKHLLRARGYA